ncbi:MAG TPA: hypothetical protein ENG14_01695 [Thermodesulforhabdus norvegica]|uniref:Uncharacterized protein n=1 Tax=Thermodesulforhabdus norvegica TaxID=39841 RepID=A0A7C1AVG3_9BACT|nr:hypothetical protein [Thermodesulforhabdus norvegica]
MLSVLLFGCIIFTAPSVVWGVQVHSSPEGLYVHQMAHGFFIVSLAILMYWLRSMKLIRYKGWRFINWSALFFILWNLDAMIIHYFDGTEGFVTIDEHTWEGHIIVASQHKIPAMLYYFGKMDHFLCVPAAIFLYLGLKALAQQVENNGYRRGEKE